MDKHSCNFLLPCTAILVGVAIILYTVWIRSWKLRDQLPKGTLGLPFIGETLQFISSAYSSQPENFMEKRRSLYGKVFKSHLFGSPTVVSIDAEVSRVVLQSDASVFVPFYPKSLTELMGESSILLINGSLQKRVHGLIACFFKSPKLMAHITMDTHRYVKQTISGWKDGDLVYIQDEAKNIAFRVLVKSLVSLDPGEEMELLKQEFQEFIAGLMSLPINLPGSRLYKSLQAKKKMVKLIKSIIHQKKQERILSPSNAPRDMLDVLLGDKSEQMTEELISNNIIDLMIPGEDSVPLLMTLAVKFLADCPPALQQLKQENMELKRSKTGVDEQLSWSDYLSLSFTQNVITETLRMGNIISGVMRKSVKDVKIKGYFIPKDWCVFTYFRSVHLDDANYNKPYQFNPWRWQDKKEVSSSNFTPFGGGQRLCAGMDMARLEASIFLHHLVTSVRWEAQEDTMVNFPTVRMKKRMPIKINRIS